MMTGMKDRQKIIEFFLNKGAKHTVFKMGHRGSSIAYLENGAIKEIRTPVYETSVIDTTGAGDSYCAGFIKGMSLGWDLQQCAMLGSAAAAQVVTGLGSDAGIVDFESTEQLMKERKTLPLDD